MSTSSLAQTLKQRRENLSQYLTDSLTLWSGSPPSRNFPANTYPFRASSHFLYFAGVPLINAVVEIREGQLSLFMDEATPAEALWHGPSSSREEIAARIGADAAYPLQEAPVSKPLTETVINAIIQLRLTHDDWGIQEIRRAAKVSMA